MKTNKMMLSSVVFGAACAVVPLTLQAQTFPDHPVTIVAPYAPGASTDTIARLVQPKLQASLGQPVIVENRPGADGSVGAASVAKSPHDGYRILIATQPVVAINSYFQKDSGFDPFRDLMPLTSAASSVMSIAVNASLPVNNLAELIAYVKKNPGKVSFGSPGTGSPQHISGVVLAQRADMVWTHVPYKGGAPMVSDLLAGHVQVGIATLSVFKPLLGDKRLRLIVVGGKTRFPGLPDVPSIMETFPGFDLTSWFAFYAPAGTPAPIAARLVADLTKALESDDVRARLADIAMIANPEGPAALDKLGHADFEAYGKIIRENKISAE
jgi:tripartite-type tricarboxylate transporter receptor subunit TctC